MTRYLSLFVLTLLPACATQQIETAAAPVADQVRQAAELTLCKGITVGAWVRAYGTSPDKAAAWKALCADAPITTPAK